MIPISYNIRSLLVRRATTLAAVVGIALVVFVFSGSLMLAEGVKKTMSVSGKNDVAVVVRKGADGELSSSIEVNVVSLIGAAPGVRRGPDGQPLAVAELMMVISPNKVGETNSVSNVVLRGVPPSAFSFRPEVRILEGRLPKPGTDEAIVGRSIAGRFIGTRVGETLELRKNRPANIVGTFEAGGTVYESEIWLDAETLAQSFGRTGSLSAVRAQLESASAFDAFETAIESDKRLGLEAMRESQFYEKQTEGTSGLTTMMGTAISFFFAIGAIIGAMITMYASIAHRQREIGTLRALGFRRRTILGSFLLESTFIALIGGVIGTIAALALTLVKVPLMNQANFSEMVFRFTPSAATLLTSLIISVVMGVLGGFLPAVRAARLSTVKAMRDF